jgi:hypothetical protein
MKFDFKHSTMSPVLPFDIINLIIDIVGENKDTDLLKELALVSHSFLQICSKHLFATVELHDADPIRRVASSKKGFVKLLKSRPEVVKYICELTYTLNYDHLQFLPLQSPHLDSDNDDNLLSPILPNFLRTIPHLNCLKIDASELDWNSLNSSLTSAFLHLMHLPTLNHLDLSYIHNFPLSSLTSSVNLLRLDISHLTGETPELIVQSEMMPKIREFQTSKSTWLTTKLLHAKMQDGRPAFNFMDLRRLSMTFIPTDEQNVRYLLKNAKLLEKLHLLVGFHPSIVGFLFPSARNLKVLNLSISLYSIEANLPLGGLCEELEAMAGHNMLEALSCEVCVFPSQTKDIIGSVIQNMEKVLVKPGWSSLRQVSLKLSCMASGCGGISSEELQSLPDEYLSHLSKLESVAFDYSFSVVL